MSALNDIVNPNNWELENNKPVAERNWIFIGDTVPRDALEELADLHVRITELEHDNSELTNQLIMADERIMEYISKYGELS